jgi:glycosyltransferase involved in cell wall biosynthesis
MTTDVSIIICTRNRAESLRLTLRSIAACVVPADVTVELLVIDNGSTDHTRDIVLQAEMQNLSLRYVLEPKPGQSHARNSGLANSVGQVILFTDDDVRMPLNWIEGMCRPLLTGETDVSVGEVSIPPCRMAPWLLGGLQAWVASTQTLNLEDPPYMVGANMAFARAILSKVAAFDVELGPGALGFADELQFFLRLKTAGFRVRGAKGVCVEHFFDLDRLNHHSFMAMADRMGRSDAYVFYHWEHGTMSHPQITMLTKLGGRMWRRLRHLRAWSDETKVPWWKLDCIKGLAFVRQYIRESRRPRNYERHGLTKLRGVIS